MRLGDLIVGTRAWAAVNVDSVTAEGRVFPRLHIFLTLATPNERTVTELSHVSVSLFFENERLGEGILLAERIESHGRSLKLEVPISQRALSYVTSRLGQATAIDFELRWYGQVIVTWHPGERDQRVDGNLVPGEPKALSLGNSNSHRLRISRSDWFEHVIKPTAGDTYIPLEILAPLDQATPGWSNTLASLRNAESAYARGDDASVFNHLRGAFDALPGAKKNIYDTLPEPKRTAVDELVKSLAAYLHRGRHVSETGEDQGRFPVDHIDAAFALNLMRVLLSYTSLALASSQGRL